MAEMQNAENRLLPGIAHAAIIVQGAGILVGMLVYITQRDKSKYAARQGLQAAVYQVVSLVIIMVLWMLWTMIYMVGLIPIGTLLETNPNAAPPIFFWVMTGSMLIPMVLSIVLIAYGLWGAIRTWQGKEFRYAAVGKWLENNGLWSAE